MPRQLHLFKSGRQKGEMPPPPLEFEMQCVVADCLRKFLTPGWVWNHIPGGEERPAEFKDGVRVSFAGARLKRAGFQPGWPDFILLAPGTGKPHCIELKRMGNTQTLAQTEFQFWCSVNNVPYLVCYSVKAALDALGQWGAIRKIHTW